jgi:hypothetical protein
MPGSGTDAKMPIFDLVTVDRHGCQRVANILAQAGIPQDREEVHLPLPPDRVGNFYLALVAICHQTQTLGGRVSGLSVRGWDYLQGKWLEAVQRDEHLLDPHGWISLSPDALIRIFTDAEAGNTLTAVEQRAHLLNDLGEGMRRGEWASLSDLYELSSKRIATDVPNLTSLLGSFRAYNDPVRKKSFFLLGLMRNSVGWTYADEEELGAPVDYHEMRGHLRLGTVVIHTVELRDKLLNRTPVDETEDVALRAGVAEAIRTIADLAGMRDRMRFHYLFWNLFRSICLREQPYCRTPAPDNALPERYAHLVGGDNGGTCPFRAVCPSADLSVRYLEHSFDTDWY